MCKYLLCLFSFSKTQKLPCLCSGANQLVFSFFLYSCENRNHNIVTLLSSVSTFLASSSLSLSLSLIFTPTPVTSFFLSLSAMASTSLAPSVLVSRFYSSPREFQDSGNYKCFSRRTRVSSRLRFRVHCESTASSLSCFLLLTDSFVKYYLAEGWLLGWSTLAVALNQTSFRSYES